MENVPEKLALSVLRLSQPEFWKALHGGAYLYIEELQVLKRNRGRQYSGRMQEKNVVCSWKK
jgi:hypothetical protein